MVLFTTQECGAHGHAELTLQFRQRCPVPIEQMLLSHVERSVAAGARFSVGQLVQVGWAQLRVCSRADGTMGFEEREAGRWVEHCDQSLMFTWLQNEVAASLGLEDRTNFPRQDQRGLVCDRAATAKSWLLARRPPRNSDDSGWYLRCLDDTHNHERGGVLKPMELHLLAMRFPFATQFLALPVGSDIVIDGAAKRISSRIYLNGITRTPIAGSYLATLPR